MSLKKIVSISLLVLIIIACDSSTDKEKVNTDLQDNFISTYAEIAYKSYNESYTKLQELQTAIDVFVANPDSLKLVAAKDAWLASREPYGQTEVFRFTPPSPIEEVEGNVNPWPLDENWIDYVYDFGSHTINASGIINNTTLDLTEAVLRDNHEGDQSETNVSLGYHAIEFLLWGQDFSDSGPGTRPYQDYSDTDTLTGQRVYNALNKDRRRTYLKLVTEILVADIKTVVDEWAVGGTYRTQFVAQERNDALRKILRGMGALATGELGAERMGVAMLDKSKEDTHSCFSDNTHRDIILNAKGIQNLYLGTYGTYSGASLYDAIKDIDSSLAEKLKTQFETTATTSEEIPVPFEQAILDEAVGHVKIQACINSLDEEAKLIVEMADAFGIDNLSTEL